MKRLIRMKIRNLKVERFLFQLKIVYFPCGLLHGARSQSNT